MLLVYPLFGVSTVWAYSALAERRARDLTNSQDNLDNIQLLFDILEKKDFSRSQPCLRNDLEEVVSAKHPVIGEIRQQLLDAGALAARMSGSGSTVFGLFPDEKKAEDASLRFPGCWTRVVRTLTYADDCRG
ncbi:MAG: 4-diphosphocytidyl-2-C-methyl-D-erythritol kinase [Nitrospirae bacterium]|nr:MAG: 4-diphosphocytidyl-2-C-methyl-D-erythritol kinase [Nitrospirota bacterium]